MPLTYLELERVILSEKHRNILSWSDYRRLGTLANITEETTLLRATQLFHDLVIGSLAITG